MAQTNVPIVPGASRISLDRWAVHWLAEYAQRCSRVNRLMSSVLSTSRL